MVSRSRVMMPFVSSHQSWVYANLKKNVYVLAWLRPYGFYGGVVDKTEFNKIKF